MEAIGSEVHTGGVQRALSRGCTGINDGFGGLLLRSQTNNYTVDVISITQCGLDMAVQLLRAVGMLAAEPAILPFWGQGECHACDDPGNCTANEAVSS